ncbi:glycosyltransferase family 1 protein [Corynebacterium sp. p3-SID1145]|uniref:glycosyltransferase family 1 protein n=1 Tax=unclassified Corynebacterium TaxID=2624378 RepID=UPI0021A9EC48|nr:MULTISPECIES: glycosyltransferase family 1 protein [unclassified Corynebacterium]MCT1452720.1 glycosyltransferase family 1 protein [Corynebacterium sp. p3-SID1145]MCT1461622.1 glycosyltransferase family 1 protein [Corynebacterium sp. p3-SID1140]
MSQPTHLVVGPDGHGVTEYALALAAVTDAPVIREEEFSSAPLPAGFIHTTFTDHLFGPSPDAAVDDLLARAGQRRLSISFHDIPQPEEGEERFARRAPAYLRLASACAESGGVAVTNSDHEAHFFRSRGVDVSVVRLPIPRVESTYAPEPGTVGVLGFLYPGKGYEDVIDALAGTDYRLRFLGSVSPGHEKWADGLLHRADAADLSAEITGWLTDDELAAEMGRIAVPVCAHKHFSASGSLMTWLGAGRRVLATDSDYTREIGAWLPGRITLVDPSAPGGWAAAVNTFTESGPTDPPSWAWDDVAAQWIELWKRQT